MGMQDRGQSQEEGSNKALIALVVVGVMLALTWAVATLFEVTLAKALAGAILFLFCVFVALLLAGIG